jgi:amidase
MKKFLRETDLLCIPTAAAIAPLQGTIHYREQGANDYYKRTLSLTSIAGVARIPQISMPIANINDVPVGISLLAAPDQDAFLLSIAAQVYVG